MNETYVRDGILGKHRRHDSLLLVAILESDPHAAQAAMQVPPDSFLLKLRQHFYSQSKTISMNDEPPPVTQLESDEEVRRVQAELRKSATTKKPTGKEPAEQPYRPTSRAAVVALVACDDGKDTGELFRIRGHQFLIGRSEGDFQLPHDEMVSSRHAAITRQHVGGKPRVVVTDLQSRNGLFVRVTKAPLVHKAEVLIGGGHYRLDIIQDMVPETAEMAGQLDGRPAGTRALEGQHSPGSVVFSEIVAGRAETKIKLDANEYMIGRDSDCEIRRPNDPFAAAKHALLTRSDRGTWVIENRHTLNGIWLRMPQIVIGEGKSCEFRIGEQRFRLKFGSKK